MENEYILCIFTDAASNEQFINLRQGITIIYANVYIWLKVQCRRQQPPTVEPQNYLLRTPPETGDRSIGRTD